jgi:hypothetical protein
VQPATWQSCRQSFCAVAILPNRGSPSRLINSNVTTVDQSGAIKVKHHICERIYRSVLMRPVVTEARIACGVGSTSKANATSEVNKRTFFVLACALATALFDTSNSGGFFLEPSA